jgi:GNAT superfamily N-acetyltransferase
MGNSLNRGGNVKIVEYDDVDPQKAFYLSKLALDFPLTPELAAHIRQSDPRPFPCLAIYAVEDDIILGQVGIFRLPFISIEGREDVGGIWAVSTHPQYTGRGIASCLLKEAHKRMQEAGLRFSTLGTNRYRVAYKLYQQHGYEETNVWAIALARWETAHQPTRLWVQPSGAEGYDAIERVYQNIASGYRGFAWRHTPFARLRNVCLADIWLLLDDKAPVGYAIAHADDTMVTISNLTLQREIDAAEAIAAITAEMKSTYVQVKISRPGEIISLRRAGYHVAHPSYDSFLVKPLVPDATIEDARHLFGIGTDQFLISWLDVT